MPPPENTSLVDRYRLNRVHSEGGLGRVWLATDPDIGRDVALKEMLAQQAAEPTARARFLREARITGQLEHPNIVPVYEVGECADDGRPYYTMRFVHGPTLADAIREDHAEQSGNRWPRSRQRLIRSLSAVCNAIAHAHSRGVVHRDLKPQNIMLGRHGELLLLDWGLAKRLSDSSTEDSEATDGDPAMSETNVGSVMGTIAYMSPEQADGVAADARTDIYGLGAILFEILTGRPPHVGEDAVSVLAQILEGESPRARSVAANVPAPLDAVCSRAMARQPADRYPNANAMLEDLERWLADEPVSELPDGLWSGAARWIRRHQSWAIAVTIALVAVAVVASVAAVALGAAADRERAMREQSLVASAQLAARAVAIEIDLRWSVLEAAAAEPELARWLRAPAENDQSLKDWIETQFTTQAKRTLATSWIIMDRTGLQRARAPFAESVGKRYAFRDYFHGDGRDLKDPDATTEPIRAAHRSIVFRSQVTKRMMVAFSVPGLAPGNSSEVLGVLGMTVELGRFGVLDLGADDTQVTALVDTRNDSRGRRGLVLQHAQLVKMRTLPLEADGALASYYVPEARVAQFRELGRDRLRRVQPAPDAEPEGRQLPRLDMEYHDPVGGDFDGTWLAAFEPVLVRDRDTGWIVIAQEREAFE